MPKFIMNRASLISCDNDIIKSINSVLFNFVWGGKDKIKRLALISEYEDGDLKMPHPGSLIKTQRITCLKRYLDDNSRPWKVFLSHYLKNVGSSFLFQFNFSLSCLPWTSWLTNNQYQEPITRSLQLPHITVTAFSQTDLFLVWIYAWIQIPTETSVTNCNHKHALMLTCRHVHVRPHCFILTEARSCRLELEYFAEKISKNRLVCKNAVALPYYESCRLLVMGSCQYTVRG